MRGLRKAYANLDLIRGVDLEVSAGGVAAITGPSGSGKTTLLRLIRGDEPPDAGTIMIAGHVVSDDRVDIDPDRREVAAVPQGGGLLDERNAGANVALALPRRVRNSRPGASRVADMFTLVGLPTETAGRFPRQLSVSERQRVALARALVTKPTVLLLDEPFYAFDATTRSRFVGDLRRLLDQTSTATVLVSHDDADVTELADQHYLLTDGRLEPAG